ncbi:MAG: hypothetical protein IKL85_07410 [Lentisphaeria bacterium]|nr:hypothetical protein [Lentisphaeria bacterium]
MLISYWRWYPDKFLDLFESPNAMYGLNIIARVNMRAVFRYSDTYIDGGRGTLKSFSHFMANLAMMVLYPGIKLQYYGPNTKQTALIISDAWTTVQQNYPAFCDYFTVVSNTEGRFILSTKFGSLFSVENFRGLNAGGVTCEEFAQEEVGNRFDHEYYRKVISPAIRIVRKVNKVRDPFFPQIQHHYVTNPSRKTNEAYTVRETMVKAMRDDPKSAFTMSWPGVVAVLLGVRDMKWYKTQKRDLTPEEWTREMECVWTGSTENPIIRDSVLHESSDLSVMEERGCGNPEVVYVIGYDVSYADGAKNAQCATAVVKCEKQKGTFQTDRFKKSLVYVFDNPPPKDAAMQARQLKETFRRYAQGGSRCYIAIDSWQYGKGVLEDLHKDLGDGLPPLCTVNHEFPELERDGALPVIYAVKATSQGGVTGMHDPDAEMVRYMELEFEHGNMRLLTGNVYEGVAAYKKAHGIRDDDLNGRIAIPYIKTKEMCEQIANLVKKPMGVTIKEQRITTHIQRDMWSAFKYACRWASKLEYQELTRNFERTSEWEKEYENQSARHLDTVRGRSGVGYRGGNGVR